MSVDQMLACSDASDSEVEAGLPIVIGKSLPLVIHTYIPNLKQRPNVYNWRLMELSSTPWLRKTHRRNEV